MKIVIIGDGKVGHKLTTQLSEEDYDITIKFIKGKSATDINKLQFASFTDSLYNYVKMIGDATINMINKPDTSSSDIIDLMQNIG